jgi:hypothetical protein
MFVIHADGKDPRSVFDLRLADIYAVYCERWHETPLVLAHGLLRDIANDDEPLTYDQIKVGTWPGPGPDVMLLLLPLIMIMISRVMLLLAAAAAADNDNDDEADMTMPVRQGGCLSD